MSDPTVTTPVPTVPAVAPTATSAQVAAHQTAVNKVKTALEALPQNAANAEAYLNTLAEEETSWVSARHMKTRLIEVSALTLAAGILVGWFLRAILG